MFEASKKAQQVVDTIKASNGIKPDVKSSILERIKLYKRQIKIGKQLMNSVMKDEYMGDGLQKMSLIQNNKIQRLKELNAVLKYCF